MRRLKMPVSLALMAANFFSPSARCAAGFSSSFLASSVACSKGPPIRSPMISIFRASALNVAAMIELAISRTWTWISCSRFILACASTIFAAAAFCSSGSAMNSARPLCAAVRSFADTLARSLRKP